MNSFQLETRLHDPLGGHQHPDHHWRRLALPNRKGRPVQGLCRLRPARSRGKLLMGPGKVALRKKDDYLNGICPANDCRESSFKPTHRKYPNLVAVARPCKIVHKPHVLPFKHKI